jgi:hypothetical protein
MSEDPITTDPATMHAKFSVPGPQTWILELPRRLISPLSLTTKEYGLKYCYLATKSILGLSRQWELTLRNGGVWIT